MTLITEVPVARMAEAGHSSSTSLNRSCLSCIFSGMVSRMKSAFPHRLGEAGAGGDPGQRRLDPGRGQHALAGVLQHQVIALHSSELKVKVWKFQLCGYPFVLIEGPTRMPTNRLSFSGRTKKITQSVDWPGNVRRLRFSAMCPQW